MLKYFSHASTPIFISVISLLWLVIPSFYIPVNHDTAWLMHLTMQLLEPNNNPVDTLRFILLSDVLLHIVPAYMSTTLHIHPLFAAKTFFILLLFFFLLSYFFQLRAMTKNDKAALYLLVPLIVLAYPFFWIEFGQRDHVIFFGLFSYILTVICRETDRRVNIWLAVISGLAGFLAIALKLHYVLALLFIELYLCIRHKSIKIIFRPESLTLALASIVFFFINMLLIPEIIADILKNISNFYWTYNAPLPERFLAIHKLIWLLIFSSFVSIKLPAREKSVQTILALSILGAYTAFIMLGNTWPYRQIPFVYLCIVYASAGFAFYISGKISITKYNNTVSGNIIIGINIALFFTAYTLLVAPYNISKNFPAWLRGQPIHWGIYLPGYAEEEKILHEIPSIKSIFVLSSDLYPHTLVMMQNNYRWVSRYPCMWMLPAWAIGHADSSSIPENVSITDMDLGIAELYHNTDNDLRAQKPDAMIIDLADKKTWFNEVEFNYIKEFNAHVPYFKQIWPEYIFYKGYIFNERTPFAVFVRRDLLDHAFRENNQTKLN